MCKSGLIYLAGFYLLVDEQADGFETLQDSST
jgi:hypothetical protein